MAWSIVLFMLWVIFWATFRVTVPSGSEGSSLGPNSPMVPQVALAAERVAKVAPHGQPATQLPQR